MKSYSGKEVCKLLEKAGWILKRIKGSHHIYSKTGEKAIVTVPVHGKKSLKIGLLRAILKAAHLEG